MFFIPYPSRGLAPLFPGPPNRQNPVVSCAVQTILGGAGQAKPLRHSSTLGRNSDEAQGQTNGALMILIKLTLLPLALIYTVVLC